MADDQALLKLLAAVDVAGAKAVVIGDPLQLDAVEPGGGLESLISRHGPAVHVLDENIRQRDPAERAALEQLRGGSVAEAVDWYRRNDRFVAAPTRDEALDAAVAAWEADLIAGHEAVPLAWRRRDVADLNHRARQRLLATGAIIGSELEAPGGKHYAAGDRVVTLAPSGDGRYVTSERGTVTAVHDGSLAVRFDAGPIETLADEDLAADRLDHAYAVTVHRTQGATVDRAHVFADGGGRELAYVAMSRAREATPVYVAADDLDQAVEDLTAEWSVNRRQRWTLDVDQRGTTRRAKQTGSRSTHRSGRPSGPAPGRTRHHRRHRPVRESAPRSARPQHPPRGPPDGHAVSLSGTRPRLSNRRSVRAFGGNSVAR